MKPRRNNFSRQIVFSALVAVLAGMVCLPAAFAGGAPSEEFSGPLNGWEKICEGVDLSPTATATFVDPMTRRACRYRARESQARARVDNSSAQRNNLLRLARQKD